VGGRLFVLAERAGVREVNEIPEGASGRTGIWASPVPIAMLEPFPNEVVVKSSAIIAPWTVAVVVCCALIVGRQKDAFIKFIQSARYSNVR
jgi:hypothetical protein